MEDKIEVRFAICDFMVCDKDFEILKILAGGVQLSVMTHGLL